MGRSRDPGGHSALHAIGPGRRPWCPRNLEFIQRINGLPNEQAVKDIVLSASYLVLGLGDVYLGAPVATPLDPRHRLVTTKYNPARTWTPENAVGIGGAYLCIYGMEGPGGYQFVGRTIQVWNRYSQGDHFEKPWLLRPFDQLRFFEVSNEELLEMSRAFPLGRLPLRITETTFSPRTTTPFSSEKRKALLPSAATSSRPSTKNGAAGLPRIALGSRASCTGPDGCSGGRVYGRGEPCCGVALEARGRSRDLGGSG